MLNPRRLAAVVGGRARFEASRAKRRSPDFPLRRCSARAGQTQADGCASPCEYPLAARFPWPRHVSPAAVELPQPNNITVSKRLARASTETSIFPGYAGPRGIQVKRE